MNDILLYLISPDFLMHYGRILIRKTERKRVEIKRQTEIDGKHGRDG